MTGRAGGPAVWPVLVATSVNVVLVLIGATSLTILLPEVAREFDATPAEATWFLLAYQLAMTPLVVVFGRLSDIVGRKRVYLVGVSVFLVGSLAAGLVTSTALFIVARLVQGVGAAAVITNTTAILTDVFPARRLPTALGINSASAAVGHLLGPVVGGVASEVADWRWIFLVSGPAVAISMVVSWRLVPGAPGGGRERMDVRGAVALTASMSLFVAGMSLGSQTGWGNLLCVALVVASVLVMALFVLLQARAVSPLVDLRLFGVPRLPRRYVAVLLCGFSQYAVILLLSSYLQATHGFEPFDVAMVVVVSPAATVVAAQLAGRLVGRLPAAALAMTGMALIGAGAASMAVLVLTDTVAVGAYAALAVLGVGIGLFMTPNTSLIMYITPVDRRGVSNGIRATMLNTGYLVTTAVALQVSTAPLDASARRAVFAGAFPLAPAAEESFRTGVVLALAVLVVTSVVGVLCSGPPRRVTDGPPPRTSTVSDALPPTVAATAGTIPVTSPGLTASRG